MRQSHRKVLLVFILLIIFSLPVLAEDYIRLRDGQIIPCAILRQDTFVVYTTDWDLRHLNSPPLQVYTRDEIESIWFTPPEAVRRIPYVPRASRLEAGGSLGFQTWAESRLARRHLILFSLHGGLGITEFLGLELDGSFTFPMGGKPDSAWYSYDPGYQVVMNAVVQPVVWRGIVPFGFAGGGASVGIPANDLLLTASNDVRNVIDIGLGIKWGADGIGYRIEWRHNFYAWTPDAVDARGLRVREQTGDASAIRASLFIYR